MPGGPIAKRLRTQQSRSFEKIAKSRIRLGVIDKGYSDGKVLRDKWRWVEAALAAKCFELQPLLSAKTWCGSRAT